MTRGESVERMRADLEAYREERPTVWIVCHNHRRAHRIQLFQRTPEGTWHAEKGTSAASKRKHAAEGSGSPVPERDKPLPRTRVRGDYPLSRLEELQVQLDEMNLRGRAPWEPPEERTEPDPHETFDLTCRRCRRVGRHITFQRRADKLWPLLDLLAGQQAREATPELLSRMVSETTRGN